MKVDIKNITRNFYILLIFKYLQIDLCTIKMSFSNNKNVSQTGVLGAAVSQFEMRVRYYEYLGTKTSSDVNRFLR